MLPQLGIMEMLVVMGVAVLLFGKRLPEVGRSLGKGIVEFKKGLRGMEDGFDLTSLGNSSTSDRKFDDHARSSSPSAHADSSTSVPKFEPPPTAPAPRMEYQPQPSHD